jgi:hypothetical protein
MPIDPQAKLDRWEKKKAKTRAYAAKRAAESKKLRMGNMTNAEKAIVTKVVQNLPAAPTNPQVTALATILQRKPGSIRKTIAEARATFQQNAKEYVDIHMKSARSDDPDVARKAAQWAIEHMAHRDKAGNVERIVEAPDAEDSRPDIRIGINLGGMPPRGTPIALDAEIAEDE